VVSVLEIRPAQPGDAHGSELDRRDPGSVLGGLSVGLVLITRERNRAILLQRRAEERARWVLLEVAKIDEALMGSRPVRVEPWQRQFIERVLSILERYVREFGDDFDSRYATADVCLRLGHIQHYLGSPPEIAEAYYRRALPRWEALAREFPADPDCLYHLAGCLINVGQVEYDRNPGDGEPFYRRALRLLELLSIKFPENPRYRVLLGGCLVYYGRVFERTGRPHQAEPDYRRALSILGQAAAEPLERPGSIMVEYGLRAACGGLESILTATGQLDQVDRVYGDTLILLENLGPASSKKRAILQNQWAWSLITRPDVQSRDLRRAVDLARRAVELTSRTDAQTWLLLGLALDRTGDLQGSDDAFRRGIELGAAKADSTLNGFTWRIVSNPRLRMAQPTWAVRIAERAVKLLPEAAQAASAWNTLGVAEYRAGDWKAAIAALEKSEALGPDKSLAFNGFFLAMAHWQVGQKDKARTWYDEAVAWMEKNQPKDLELIRFRAEAAALLGLDDLPDDVFARP
jgi:tetratricopeptide (TPR) repeat protein